jgi:hypothetical protein
MPRVAQLQTSSLLDSYLTLQISNFVLLKMYGAQRGAGIRWTTYADNIDRVQTIFTEKKKLLLAGWIM